MIQKTVWRWELTPLQAFEGYTFSRDKRQHTFPLGLPFASPKRQLTGTSFTYQLALSDCALSHDINSIRYAQPELEVSGDRRSGIQALDGNRVIGSLTIPGHRIQAEQTLMVHSDYRGHRLGQRLVQEWNQKTKRPLVLSQQDLGPVAARAFLTAHIETCHWAIEQGKDLPDAVRSELETNAQVTEMLQVLAEVERTGNSFTFRAKARHQ